MDKKKLIIIVAIITIIASTITSIYLLTKDKSKDNTINGLSTVANKELLKDKTIEKISIKDQNLISRNNSTTFIAKIINTADTEYYIDKLYVTFENETTLEKILLYQNLTLLSNEEKDVYLLIDKDLSNVTNINYVIQNEEKVE